MARGRKPSGLVEMLAEGWETRRPSGLSRLRAKEGEIFASLPCRGRKKRGAEAHPR